MSILETAKRILGIKPLDISELNRRATQDSVQEAPVPACKDPLEGIHVTEEYKKVRSILEDGCPVVFVTGNAGTGKSTLIHYLRTVLNKRLVVLAPTGVAALNSGGVTIHSFFHLPPKIHEEEDIKRVYDRKLYQKLDLIIIDEISMVRCDLMDSIDRFLRKNRSSDISFGGVQLLLVGDLFQLPPVVTTQERKILKTKGYTSRYFFSSFSLQSSTLVPVELTAVYRQKSAYFVSLLNKIRIGENIDFPLFAINDSCFTNEKTPRDITLTCTNDAADKINIEELHSLPAKEYSFKGEIKGRFSIEEDSLPSPIDLRLKVGAHVMFTKNDEERRWVNGTLGIVRLIDGESISVELATDHAGCTYDVQQVVWAKYKYAYNAARDKIVAEKVGEYIQYPLMLAWAVTIHKSQGRTLENVLVDLGHGAFAPGQVYVALSRCRTMEGIRLSRPVRNTDVKYDPMIKRFYVAMDEMRKSERADKL
jgi:ATP-dependent DNA helicase PIF1